MITRRWFIGLERTLRRQIMEAVFSEPASLLGEIAF